MNRSERREAILRYAQENAEQFGNFKVGKIATGVEMAEMFKMDVSRLRRMLNESGSSEVRKSAQEKRYQTPLPPSPQLAWVIGYVVGLKPSQDEAKLSKSESNETIARKHFENSRSVFGENSVTLSTVEAVKEGGAPSYKVYIRGVENVKRLGDLSYENFPSTFNTRYDWIMRNPVHVWQFIEGLFENHGRRNAKGITFHTQSPVFAQFIVEALCKAGLDGPTLNMIKGGQKIWGINVLKLRDLQQIANAISTGDPRKQEFLNEVKKRRPSSTKDYLLQKWDDLSLSLGRTPTLEDLNEACENDSTLFRPSTYVTSFGNGHVEATLNILGAYSRVVSLFPIDKSDRRLQALDIVEGFVSGESAHVGGAFVRLSKIFEDELDRVSFDISDAETSALGITIDLLGFIMYTHMGTRQLIKDYLDKEGVTKAKNKSDRISPDPQLLQAIFSYNRLVRSYASSLSGLPRDTITNVFKDTFNSIGRIYFGHVSISRIVERTIK